MSQIAFVERAPSPQQLGFQFLSAAGTGLGAKVVALANAGGDMINATKQANEFGLSGAGQRLVSLLIFIIDTLA